MTRHQNLVGIVLLITSLAAAQDSQPNPSWEIMRKHDADGDGKVSLSEYPRGENIFRRIDRDGDGYLTERDFIPGRFGRLTGAPNGQRSTAREESRAARSGEPRGLARVHRGGSQALRVEDPAGAGRELLRLPLVRDEGA